VFLPFFKADFEELMRVEGDQTKRQPDGRPGLEQSRAAAQAWPRLAGYAISAFLSMLVLTMALAGDLGWRGGTADPAWPPLRLTRPMLGVLLTLLVLLAPAGVALRQAFKPHLRSGLERPSGAQLPAWCCFVLGIATCALVFPGLADQAIQPLAVIQALLLTAFAVHSILGNGAWLNLGHVGLASRAAVSTVSLAVLVSVYWSLTDAVRPGGSAASPGATVRAWALTVLVVGLLVELTAASVYIAGGRPYRTDYAPAKNVLQDLFHLTLLWFVLGWLPQFVLTNIPASTDERWAAIGTILAGFLLLFGPAFLWILENNDTHVERQRRVRKVPPRGVLAQLHDANSSTDRIRTLRSRIIHLIRSLRHPNAKPDKAAAEEAFLIRLSGHTAVQNTLALSLAGISVIGTVGVSAGLTPNATGLATLSTSSDPQAQGEPSDTDGSAAPV
jgi:hypothetical protein